MKTTVIVALLALGCAGQIEDAAPAPADGPRTCDVMYLDEPCTFECTDCDNQYDCESAVYTALDHCSFQRAQRERGE